MDKVANEVVRGRAGIETELHEYSGSESIEMFEHMERMDKYRMTKVMLIAKKSVRRMVWSRPWFGSMPRVKVALSSREMMAGAARQYATGKN